MIETSILISIGIISSLLSIGAIILSSIALIKCLAAEKATHTVTFQPLDESLKSGLEQGWATAPSTLDKQQKLYKADIEEKMPEFATDEEEEKVYTF